MPKVYYMVITVCHALDYHQIVAMAFSFGWGFPPTGLISGVALYCLYCVCFASCTKFCKLILTKIINIVATMQMSDFTTKMHQIRFRLELRPRPRWGSLQRSPGPLAGGARTPPRPRPFGPRFSGLQASILGPSGLDSSSPRL